MKTPPAETRHGPPTPAGTPRRHVVAAMLAGGLSAAAGLLAIFPGTWVFLNPLLRKKKENDDASWVRIASLDALPADGLPHRFPIIVARTDAWNLYPPAPIGAVYLLRKAGDDKLVCYSATCPHLGCGVDFKADRDQFQCPCHTSGFALNGDVLFGPSPRPLDTLTAQVRNGREVWVKYEKFRSGVEAKEPQPL